MDFRSDLIGLLKLILNFILFIDQRHRQQTLSTRQWMSTSTLFGESNIYVYKKMAKIIPNLIQNRKDCRFLILLLNFLKFEEQNLIYSSKQRERRTQISTRLLLLLFHLNTHTRHFVMLASHIQSVFSYENSFCFIYNKKSNSKITLLFQNISNDFKNTILNIDHFF